ncbi:MAG: hypothetical protein FWH31_09455 [Streptococcaceae bacterium]|nr:hypothetical protein [Streptococcaceae bacterium]
MKVSKIVASTVVVLSVAELGVGGYSIKASAATTPSSTDQANNGLQLGNLKKTDTITEVSGGVYVHGKVTISNTLDAKNEEVVLNTDTDSRAKKVEQVLAGETLDVVTVPQEAVTFSALATTLSGQSTPPTALMSLGSGAYATGTWGSTSGWRYSNYAFQPTPVSTSNKPLYFIANKFAMWAGDSGYWGTLSNGPYYITAGNSYNVPDKSGDGNVYACWANSPVSGSGYKVTNEN